MNKDGAIFSKQIERHVLGGLIKHPKIFSDIDRFIEEKDFYTFQIDNKWVLRKYRKTDDETKRYVRNKYWEKRNGKN